MKKEAYSKNKRSSHFNVLDALIIILIIAMVVGIYFRFNVVDHFSGMKEQKEYVISFSVDDIRATTPEFIKVGDEFYLENEELFGTLISESEGSASALNITPALKLFTDSNGAVVPAYYPNNQTRIDAKGRLSCLGSYSEDVGFCLDGTKYFAPGQTVSLHSELVSVTVTIISIEAAQQ